MASTIRGFCSGQENKEGKKGDGGLEGSLAGVTDVDPRTASPQVNGHPSNDHNTTAVAKPHTTTTTNVHAEISECRIKRPIDRRRSASFHAMQFGGPTKTSQGLTALARRPGA